MKAIRYDNDKHRKMVDQWAAGWKMNPYPDGYLPTVGYIVPEVAVAYLFVTDSDVAYMEAVLSNPEASDEDRGNAIDVIADAIVAAAKECGSKWLIGASNVMPLIDRAERHGFRVADAPVYQLIKDLQ